MDYRRISRKLREDSRIFGGTFEGIAEGSKEICQGDALRDMGESIGGIDKDRQYAGGIGINKESRGEVIASTDARGLSSSLQRNLLKLASGLIDKEKLLILDLSDIRKGYAKKMQYITGVCDGSENEVGNGYWLCKVVAADTHCFRL